jgi:hypothetical protein
MEKNITGILSGLTEEELFKLLKKRYINLEKIEDQFSTIDSYDASTDIHYELKCRYQHYDNLIIEKKKYLALLDKRESYYVCSTPKGIYMFPIKELEEPVWRIKYLPRHTEFNNTNFIEKEVGELSIKKALELTQILIYLY